MSALTLTLKRHPDLRVDMSALSCQHLHGKQTDDIAAIELPCGKQRLRVDSLFELSGSDTDRIVIKNSSDKLDCIGKALDGGTITVEGDAGAYLGLGMRAGTVKVSGNAGLYAGGELRQGYLEIAGDAGDFLGAALPGNKAGMRGGMILVKGNAGDRVGDHLRRGVVLIEGDVGDYCAARMTAGTIAVLGGTGRFLGYAMRRGTVLLWRQPQLAASFNDCGSHTLGFLPLLFNSFQGLDSRFADRALAFTRVRRYAGDMAEMGRGEILVRL